MSEFILPAITFALGAAGLLTGFRVFYYAAIAVGLFALTLDSVRKLFAKKFSLDYIAILAMVVALATDELLAGAVISLMILVSESLEAYGSREAEAALKHLVEKIPKTCAVKQADGSFHGTPIQEVREGDTILVRDGEIVPLDGYLLSPRALVDEANLTGEFEPQPYRGGRFMKSGLVNAGEAFELRVSGTFSTSTYQKIVGLVQEAKRHPARIVRLAKKYNYGFTAITLVLAAGAWLISGGDPVRLLAVLVIATPCPLLIAAPISFLGGLNVASRRNIIVKRPAALETLSQATAIFFDKTGTLTLGVPELREVRMLDGARLSQDDVLAVASAIEFHSIHPLAKAIARANSERNSHGNGARTASHITETPGEGIEGVVDGAAYRLKHAEGDGIVIEMRKDGRPVAKLVFDDVMKPGTLELLEMLRARYRVAILTGDSKENAERLFDHMEIHARCTPEEKYAAIKDAQGRGEKVVMVGDGLNDAPALALADVGIVFSGTENSASIEAASVAILSRDVALVAEALAVAKRSTKIAEESILWGIGLSVVGMVIAMLGYIPPVTGAVLQEGIDVSVIFNALRAARAIRAPSRTSPSPSARPIP